MTTVGYQLKTWNMDEHGTCYNMLYVLEPLSPHISSVLWE
jgi:uncharacterized membrane protein